MKFRRGPATVTGEPLRTGPPSYREGAELAFEPEARRPAWGNGLRGEGLSGRFEMVSSARAEDFLRSKIVGILRREFPI